MPPAFSFDTRMTGDGTMEARLASCRLEALVWVTVCLGQMDGGYWVPTSEGCMGTPFIWPHPSLIVVMISINYHGPSRCRYSTIFQTVSPASNHSLRQ